MERGMSKENADHQALQEAVGAVLQSECPLADVRKYVNGDEALSRALWTHAAGLGWLGIAAPEAFGGSGLDFGSLAVVYEQLGRHIAPISFLPAQLCIDVLTRAGTEQQKQEWLEPLASGSVRGVVAIGNSAMELKLEREKDRVRLDGAALIAGGGTPELMVVFARDLAGRRNALLVDRRHAPVEMTAAKVHDGTRALALANFNACEIPAEQVLAEGEAATVLEDHLIDHASIAMACDSVGGAFAIFDITVDYLKTRSQFGRTIGSFQALKHRCATLKVGLEAARAMLASALEERKQHSPSTSAYASLTKFHACDMYVAASAEAIQLHGGIGFTWESPCHLFLKRAKFNQALFGDSAWHQDRAARLLLSPAA
jgi:alkylation response protein AidB-like acyl-CoA dehydrogenase